MSSADSHPGDEFIGDGGQQKTCWSVSLPVLIKKCRRLVLLSTTQSINPVQLGIKHFQPTIFPLGNASTDDESDLHTSNGGKVIWLQ
jgi:hypothetical protein